MSFSNPVSPYVMFLVFTADSCRGATMDEKLRGTKVWVPTLGRLRPAPG